MTPTTSYATVKSLEEDSEDLLKAAVSRHKEHSAGITTCTSSGLYKAMRKQPPVFRRQDSAGWVLHVGHGRSVARIKVQQVATRKVTISVCRC